MYIYIYRYIYILYIYRHRIGHIGTYRAAHIGDSIYNVLFRSSATTETPALRALYL